jgi:DNA-binding response OmpR family regulator
MRILLIEDERTLAGFIEQSLRAEPHVVTVCHDAPNGEAAALSGDYALVLLDLTLPGKDGLEVLDAIRARLPELPVILLTARTAVEQRVEGLDRGANDYVTKPFSLEELLARGPCASPTHCPRSNGRRQAFDTRSCWPERSCSCSLPPPGSGWRP